jgi:hypothetical protein
MYTFKYCLEIYNKNKNNIPVGTIKSNGDGMSVRYADCEKNYYVTLLNQDNNLCELICLPGKLYFDYDKSVNLTDDELKAWNWKHTIDNIKKHYVNIFQTHN